MKANTWRRAPDCAAFAMPSKRAAANEKSNLCLSLRARTALHMKSMLAQICYMLAQLCLWLPVAPCGSLWLLRVLGHGRGADPAGLPGSRPINTSVSGAAHHVLRLAVPAGRVASPCTQCAAPDTLGSGKRAVGFCVALHMKSMRAQICYMKANSNQTCRSQLHVHGTFGHCRLPSIPSCCLPVKEHFRTTSLCTMAFTSTPVW